MEARFSALTSPLSLADVRRLVEADLETLDDTIRTRLHSDVMLVSQVADYIVNSGGKRLRPLLVLLVARACGYTGSGHVEAAAIIEFIHTATLLHDDVVDGSDLRRGQDTANAMFGNSASVLVGDFLYSRAFQMMVSLERMGIMAALADATNRIAEGEVMQLMNIHDPETSEARYMEIIECKTSKLFEAGAVVAGLLSDQPPEVLEALATYGMKLGNAFQLTDDALDYRSSAEEMGKNAGDDLAEGKPTLPLIHALRKGSDEERLAIREAIENGGAERMPVILKAIESTDALHYTARLAKSEADSAISALGILPESPFRDGLAAIADIAISRSY